MARRCWSTTPRPKRSPSSWGNVSPIADIPRAEGVCSVQAPSAWSCRSAVVAGSGKNGTPAGTRWDELVSLAAEQLWDGRTARQVVRTLQEQGLDPATAAALVEQV